MVRDTRKWREASSDRENGSGAWALVAGIPGVAGGLVVGDALFAVGPGVGMSTVAVALAGTASIVRIQRAPERP